MSYGSILLMCFLMFVLGGQDRLPWAPMPVLSESASEAESASAAISAADSHAEASPEVRVAAVEQLVPPQADGQGEAPHAPTTKENRPPAAVDCAAGFPLSLPPEAPKRYATLDWMAEEGRAATIRYAFANGGLLEYTQTVIDSDRTAPDSMQLVSKSLQLPRLTPALSTPALEFEWQDVRRRYVVRSFGLSETETLAWIRSLGTHGTTCTPSIS